MVKQLEECMEFFGQGVSMLVSYLATNTFLEVREDAEQLNDI